MASENKAFQNNSIFFAPIWTDDYKSFVSELTKDSRYHIIPKKRVPQYLLPYITRIYTNDSLFMQFELNKEDLPHLCMFSECLHLETAPVLQSMRLSCFSTGCIFAEFYITYEGLTVDQITDFTYRFKNAMKTDTRNGYTLTLNSALEELLPKNIKTDRFFTGADFKQECKMFHQIGSKTPFTEEELQKYLVHLRRGYHRNFAFPKGDSDYDMIYQPYPYDHWAGSQEGIVNIFHHSGDSSTDYYLTHFKPAQLALNYRFMYLILLNQRFSAIHYLEQLTAFSQYSRKEQENLTHKIAQLKTVFSFNVVSDDHLYQNIYTRMYTLLDIDRLLEDIRDNEEKIEMLQSYESLENEKMTSRFLFGLSILSFFSVLVDAAGYFDRLPVLQEFSTPLSFVCLLIIVGSYFVWWLKYRKR